MLKIRFKRLFQFIAPTFLLHHHPPSCLPSWIPPVPLYRTIFFALFRFTSLNTTRVYRGSCAVFHITSKRTRWFPPLLILSDRRRGTTLEWYSKNCSVDSWFLFDESNLYDDDGDDDDGMDPCGQGFSWGYKSEIRVYWSAVLNDLMMSVEGILAWINFMIHNNNPSWQTLTGGTWEY